MAPLGPATVAHASVLIGLFVLDARKVTDADRPKRAVVAALREIVEAMAQTRGATWWTPMGLDHGEQPSDGRVPLHTEGG